MTGGCRVSRVGLPKLRELNHLGDKIQPGVPAGLLAGRRVKAGRRAPGYGMNAGEVICSEPVAASGMGVPAAAPAGCRNTLERFFSPPTKARRSPARETA